MLRSTAQSGFLEQLFRNFDSLRKRTLSKTFEKLKINMISNNLKTQKIVDSSEYSSELSRIKSYSSILTEEANAPHQQGERNFEAEKSNANIDATLDGKIREINYFEKHLNQTIKPDLRVENFPVS